MRALHGMLVAAIVLAAPLTAAAEPAQTGWVPLPEGMGSVVEAPSSRLLYLNRCAEGCSITPGFDDSRADTSSIVAQTAFIPAYPWGDESWSRMVTCVRTLYASFDIEVTDIDPGAVPHFEAIVAGEPTDVGMSPGVGGVAPFTCGVIDNAITFTFAGKLGDQAQRICEVVGQESAHAFGLDHELLCQDPMTYQSGCGNKCFQDVDATCGEWMERECACGGDTQNSFAALSEIFGTRASEPGVSITEPREGAEVGAGFFVRVEAAVPCLAQVEAFLDGASLGVIGAWPYVFNTSASLAPGEHEVRVVARDHAGGEVERTLEVTVVEGDPGGGPGTGPCAGCSGGGNNPPRGGCSAGGGGAGSVLALLAALAWLRRRVRSIA